MSSRIPGQNVPIQLQGGQIEPLWYEFLRDGGAYISYTPTVTASSGTFTTVSGSGRYKKRGRTVYINIVVTITTVGTAAGAVRVTLPVTGAGVAQIVVGRETSAGNALTGLIGASASLMQILEYDGTTAAASGRTLVMSGTYESAS